ncbi:hypothetical protein ABB37_01767 [Leptomonas pyrrhocoris]|uniref:Homologous recombination OB-fold protein OB-fold domain-containing protein n=1 Tax=Leptomonas pyrrhocoris TaxID=157538 RepID=A0A0N0DZM9_LEPPY|nr:hypothetical protein ABB37_01767 [Leptomonas pyrrhocoris]KPA85475.1 hypothetical protein ABB37_01767 [Leptomonas pyrrhocoris]|eukprot:XP_015663914.1 hypothetical protein ABB37_01767 [Leptomonas pyrrhocoris]
MDPQKVLESLAREKGVSLTSLGEVSSHFSHSGKIACCGGLMTRLVTESAADSTVLLRDGSGACYCALHGDITSRYPDVLTTGAMLLFTDITVLVLSSKVPPLLVACLQNLSGLLLPDEASSAAAAAVMDTGNSMALPAEAALDTAASDTYLFESANAKDTRTAGEMRRVPSRSRFAHRENANKQYSLAVEGAGENGTPSAAPLSPSSDFPTGNDSNLPRTSKKARVEDAMAVPSADRDDDDDAECLELVDEL